MSGQPSSSWKPLYLSGSNGHASLTSIILSPSASFNLPSKDGIESGQPS